MTGRAAPCKNSNAIPILEIESAAMSQRRQNSKTPDADKRAMRKRKLKQTRASATASGLLGRQQYRKKIPNPGAAPKTRINACNRPLHKIPTPQSASQNISKIADQFQYPPCKCDEVCGDVIKYGGARYQTSRNDW